MSILAAFMVPHPPLIVPEVGQGEERGIASTTAAYEQVAQKIQELQPETIIVTTPHSIMYSDYFHISPGSCARGSFGQFGAPQVHMEAKYDQELVAAIGALAQTTNLSAGVEGERDAKLDHATLVPLYFINKSYKDYKLVRIGLSGLPLTEHYKLGQLIQQAVNKLGRSVVIIASGDLSHRLKKEGPYGFNSSGPEYDAQIMQVMGAGNFLELLKFSPLLCEEAGECGHRSFTIMAGALDKIAVKVNKISYEGPFGVGYGVVEYIPAGFAANRDFLGQYLKYKAKILAEKKHGEDAYVRLARNALENYITKGEISGIPSDIPAEMLTTRAGAFVSLKKDNVLRGCIGTIGPVRANLAKEIMGNAISAGTEDPRFMAVQPEELAQLEYSVDVLGPIEDILSSKELDVKRYGVIVNKGSRSGLLLPNLEGIATVERQIEIAKQKAGIRPEETGVSLQRFEVIRHK